MDSLDRIIWTEEIKQLKARYFRFVDLQDWQALRTVFAPDAQLTFPAAHDQPIDLESGMALIVSHLEGVRTVHHGHMPEISILGSTTAKGIWAMADILSWSADSPTAQGRQSLFGYGHYEETYRRIGERWVIQTLRLSRLLVIEHQGDQTGQWTLSPPNLRSP